MEVQSAPARVQDPVWTSFYRAIPGGRFRITSTELIAFGMEHPQRVLDTDLWGRPAKVLLLDQPLKLGLKVSGADGVEFDLRPIRLHELPGWPPRMASAASEFAIPALMDCELRSTTFVKGSGRGQESVELVLQHSRRTFRAWLTGCPIVLMKCVEATLNQKACIGRALSDLQDIRLIGTPGD